jgi:hypothetical protein
MREYMTDFQARLVVFESESGLAVPADLEEHFRLLEARQQEVWKDMYQFYSFEAFKSIPTGLALFQGTPDYGGIVKTLERCEDCFVFADWMIMSFAYAIRLCHEPTAVNEVYIIYGDKFRKIADSFAGFMKMIDADAPELLF